MDYTIDILFPGFSGKMNDCALGWGTWALIRGSGSNILLDTGGVGLRVSFDKILERYKLKRSDINYVFLSHLHFDHACNVDLLPSATFILSEEEWKYANDLEHRDLYIQESAIIPLRNSKIQFVKQDNQEILPGITAIFTPGHTPGSISFVIHRENQEKWVLASDAAKNRGELKTREVQMTLDPIATRKSIERIVNLGNRVLPGHDGWIRIGKEGEILPEGENDKTLLFAQGVTVNGGMTSITLHMD